MARQTIAWSTSVGSLAQASTGANIIWSSPPAVDNDIFGKAFNLRFIAMAGATRQLNWNSGQRGANASQVEGVTVTISVGSGTKYTFGVQAETTSLSRNSLTGADADFTALQALIKSGTSPSDITVVLATGGLGMHVGGTEIAAAYIGSTEITKAYVGSDELG